MNIESLILQRMNSAEMKRIEKEPARARQTKRELHELPQLACCGNCANISYHGIMEVKMEWGDCEVYADSGRFCTQPWSQPCEFWRKRSHLVMINERTYSEKMIAELAGLNDKVRGGARSLDSVKIGKVARPKTMDEQSGKVKRSGAEALAFLGIGSSDDEETEEYVESGQADADLDIITEDE